MQFPMLVKDGRSVNDYVILSKYGSFMPYIVMRPNPGCQILIDANKNQPDGFVQLRKRSIFTRGIRKMEKFGPLNFFVRK